MRLKILWCLILACCWMEAYSIPAQHRELITKTLLQILGFKERPAKFEGEVAIPETLRKYYEMQKNLEYETTSLPLPGMFTGDANIVRSFRHVESPVDAKFPKHHKFRLKFNVTSIPSEEKVTTAVLQLSREAIRSKSKYQRIVVEDIVRRGLKNGNGPHLVVLDSLLVDTSSNATVTLNILPALDRWMKEPSRNYGLLVRVLSSNGGKAAQRHVRLRRDASDADWGQAQPLLLAFTDDGKNKPRPGEELAKRRRPRAARRSHRKGERDPCKRRQMHVNFHEVGWNDWIVAPLGYDAFYCSGDCEYPMADHMNTTNHAIVQSLMNSVRPNEVPKPCCVPTSLTSISMLYLDGSGNVILKNYREMVATGCGCR